MLKKLKIYPRVLIVFFVMLSIIGFLFVRGNEYSVYSGEYSLDNYKNYLIDTDKYKILDDVYEVNGEDPKLYFDFREINNDGINGVILKFKENIELSDIQIYYGYDGQNFSEEMSKRFKEGKSDEIEVLSLRKFKCLRIDIDKDFEISGFEVSGNANIKKIAKPVNYILSVIISFIISLVLSLFKNIDDMFKKVLNIIKLYLNKAKKKSFMIFGTILIVIIEFVAVVIVEKLISSGHGHINEPRLLVVFGMVFVVSISILYKDYILKYLHLYFFIVLLVIGSIHIISTPPITGTSWDDEIHYGKTSYVSWLCSGNCSYSDYRIQNYYGTLYGRNVYTVEGRSEWVYDINGVYDSNGEGIFLTDDEKEHEFTWIYIAYVPTAVTLAVGRGIGLPFTYTFMLGKLSNLAFYGLLFSISIYLIKNKGKILIALIGLIPTSVFIACSYSYDWWLIGCIVLGYSMFLSELQQDKKISVKKHLLITIILILGILTKAVYFPLLLPMMVLKKDKYENSKLCRIITVLGIIFLISTFITPILFGTKEGDSRGGDNVDAMGQVSFILTNPIEYTKILFTYLKSYVSLEKAHEYLTFFAYLGQIHYTRMCILILGIAGVIDNRKNLVKDKYYKIGKITLFISAFASVVLVATALYVSFTPVGHYTINGCQPRYLLPLLFPLIYYFGDIGLDVSKQIKNNFVNIAICIMSLIFLYGTYAQLAIFY